MGKRALRGRQRLFLYGVRDGWGYGQGTSGRAAAGRVGDAHTAALGVDDAVDDGEAQTRAATASFSTDLFAPEPLEELLARLGGDARPVIAHLQDDRILLAGDETSIAVPSGVWMIAFRNRFARTWRVPGGLR